MPGCMVAACRYSDYHLCAKFPCRAPGAFLSSRSRSVQSQAGFNHHRKIGMGLSGWRSIHLKVAL